MPAAHEGTDGQCLHELSHQALGSLYLYLAPLVAGSEAECWPSHTRNIGMQKGACCVGLDRHAQLVSYVSKPPGNPSMSAFDAWKASAPRGYRAGCMRLRTPHPLHVGLHPAVLPSASTGQDANSISDLGGQYPIRRSRRNVVLGTPQNRTHVVSMTQIARQAVASPLSSLRQHGVESAGVISLYRAT